jgi:NodT family efflux transporter outer membrane factor (OMF) lipoprotein
VTTPESSALLGIDEFYHDPRLTFLINQAVVNNRELRILEMEVQIASNEVLSRSGAYLPLMTAGGNAGLDRASNRVIEGAAIRDDEYAPGKFFSNPHSTFVQGVNFVWRLDIYRQMRNARDAAGQRYEAALEARNFFVTQLVAEVAENYYRLMALDKQIENLNQIIALQEQSLKIAEASKEFAEGTELGVLRFEAAIKSNQSQRLVVNQDIILTENRINFLLNRYPQPVDRDSSGFFDLNINALNVGVPSQLLQNRPDIRQAERELAATGLDVKVARVNFYPQLVLDAGVSLQAFNIASLFNPQAVAGNIAGGLVGPLVNFRRIRAEYLTANSNQIRAVYNYQRVVLNAFTEVVNQLTRVRNYSDSVAIRKQQMTSLETAVDVAEILFQNARTEYLDVLTAQHDLRDARVSLIDTKQLQLTAVVNAYQALGGGNLLARPPRAGVHVNIPYTHTVSMGENFWTISEQYYKSGRYYKALWAANHANVPALDRLSVGDKILIPRIDEFDPTLIADPNAPAPKLPEASSVAEPASPPPPSVQPSPFAAEETHDPAVKPTAGVNPPANSPTTREKPGDQAGSAPIQAQEPGDPDRWFPATRLLGRTIRSRFETAD